MTGHASQAPGFRFCGNQEDTASYLQDVIGLPAAKVASLMTAARGSGWGIFRRTRVEYRRGQPSNRRYRVVMDVSGPPRWHVRK